MNNGPLHFKLEMNRDIIHNSSDQILAQEKCSDSFSMPFSFDTASDAHIVNKADNYQNRV